MAAGIPVVVLDTEVSREIYGPAAEYVAQPEPGLIGAALERLLVNDEERARLIDAGRGAGRAVSWDECARRTLQVLLACADDRTSMARLSIVIVTYNSSREIDLVLGSLTQPVPATSHEIVVVDNASSDRTPALVRDKWPDVRLIESGTNLGFAAGNNRAIRTSSSELVLLLNPDTRVPAGAVDRLVAQLDARHGRGNRRTANRRRPRTRGALLRRDDRSAGRAPAEGPRLGKRSGRRANRLDRRSHDAAHTRRSIGSAARVC